MELFDVDIHVALSISKGSLIKYRTSGLIMLENVNLSCRCKSNYFLVLVTELGSGSIYSTVELRFYIKAEAKKRNEYKCH